MNKLHFRLLAIFGVVLILGSFLWNYSAMLKQNHDLLLEKSQSFFQQIVITRAWNASHGGVYVPVTDQTRPNPYLKDSLRDVITTNGISLTKINPAYMTRQISEQNDREYGFHFHITSLNPLNPNNEPDVWERNALKEFERGVKEKLERLKNDSGLFNRYMAPLMVDKTCMKCHAHQGYSVGMVRGGISIDFPIEKNSSLLPKQLIALGSIHIFVLLIGLFGLWLYYRQTESYSKMLEVKNKDLKRINSAKDNLMSIIAHDLKNPILSMSTMTDLVKNNFHSMTDEKRNKILGLISNSSIRTYNLLINLLDWSRSEMGILMYTPQEVSIHRIVGQNIQLMEEQMNQKDITIESQLIDKNVWADENMLDTIIRNLLSNAIKFTKSGGKITIKCTSTQNNQLQVSIVDNGIGIESDRLSSLFDIDRFESTHGTANEIGSGLGLKLCKKFVELNRGTIGVESTPGEGSCFYFTIPAKEESC